jgi:uncharacterized protein (DUF2267 family)
MDLQALVDHVLVRAPLDDRERALGVLAATANALISQLEPVDAHDLRRALPAEIRDRLAASATADTDLVTAIAASEPTSRGFAFEHAIAAGEAFVLELPPELLGRLRRRLPRALAELLEPRESPAAPPPHPLHPPAAPGAGTTIASGRPGSRHPLSESAPPVHRHSIAASDDPHADRKLSSSGRPQGGLMTRPEQDQREPEQRGEEQVNHLHPAGRR